jgi:hypothetical protein
VIERSKSSECLRPCDCEIQRQETPLPIQHRSTNREASSRNALTKVNAWSYSNSAFLSAVMPSCSASDTQLWRARKCLKRVPSRTGPTRKLIERVRPFTVILEPGVDASGQPRSAASDRDQILRNNHLIRTEAVNTTIMSATTIEIVPSSLSLPTCLPHLMPFHIEYSGPAPIGTYFRVKDAPGNVAQPAVDPSQDANPTAGTQSDTLSTGLEGSDGSGHGEASLSTPHNIHATAPEDTKKRYTAAFRGRTVQGLEVDLPEGYAGIVLRGDEDGGVGKQTGEKKGALGTKKGRTAGKNESRARRRSKVADLDEGDCSASDVLQDDETVRTLRPSATFSSLVLWNPDIPVDEGRDEYLRSTTEWMTLAAQVRVPVARTHPCFLTFDIYGRFIALRTRGAAATFRDARGRLDHVFFLTLL